MRIYCRVVVFGKPAAPWRPSRQMAERDAASLGLGERDIEGVFFLSGEASIVEIHEYELNRQRAAELERSTKKLGQGSQQAHHPA